MDLMVLDGVVELMSGNLHENSVQILVRSICDGVEQVYDNGNNRF